MELTKGLKKLITLTGWQQFFKILSQKEKIIFSLFLFLFLVSFSFLSVTFYFKNTEIRPAVGGTFTEGLIGQPRFINPIFAPVSDVDQDLTELIFSGLMKYNLEGKIIPDLAENYQIFENGKIWEISLKKNLFWSNNIPLTVDDVIFTIETIQNPDIKSPLRPSWLGVTVKKISDSKIGFELKNPSSIFLENLTLKIIPKHIWENISPQNFPLSSFNLEPIGSGPYQLKNLVQDKEGKIILLDLIRNPNYHGKTPNFQQVSFQFFDKEKDLLSAIENDKITAFPFGNLTNLTNEINWANLTNWTLPRYFAVFFNPEQSKVLAEKEVRQALNYGTNKKEIVNRILASEREIVDSPILPKIYGFKTPSKIYQFDLEEAKLLLEKAGFFETETGAREKVIKKELAFQFKSNLNLGSQGKEVEELQKCLAKDKEIYPEEEITGYFGPKTKEAVIRFQEKYAQDILKPFGLEKGTGEVRKATRDKLNEICFEKPEEIIPFKFSLITVNQPRLIELANLLKSQWQALGAEIEIKTYDISALEKEIIKPRNYQAILFGQVLGIIPDPFPFWHSSQKKDPGLNLALYKNKEADILLEETRQNLDKEKRKELLEKFQEILIEDAPAVFLYNPDYLYFVSKKIKGVKTGIITIPSQRFSNIEEWYIKTKRAWK
ncbi:MAG: ABC transporter substrate-binding protein [Patescibacteria group bacterium]|nr:ABC transporter substrate-binding protein [Patescibacteria group bacterium]